MFDYIRIPAASSHCRRQRSEIRLSCFGFSSSRPGGGMFAPMIKHVRYVHDFFGTLRCAQREIIVLRKIEFLAKAAKLKSESAPVSSEMPDIHERKKQLWTPFRFEKWPSAHSRFAQAIVHTLGY